MVINVDKNNKDNKFSHLKALNINIKGLARSVLFFAIMFLVLFFISKLYNKKVHDDYHIVQERYQAVVEAENAKENSYEVLVVGDSVSNAGVSPLDMWNESGFTGYTYATYGQVIEESYYNLKTLFEKQSPKVVMLESNVIFKNKGYVTNGQDTFNEVQNYYLPALKYHDIWKPLLTDKRYDGGFYKGFDMRDRITECQNRDYMVKTDSTTKICPSNKSYLDKIVDLCKEKNSKLCLLSLPAQAKPFGSVATKYEEYNCLREYARDKKIDIINMNKMWLDKKFDIDWTISCADSPEDIKDPKNHLGEHLNSIGSKTVSCVLAKEISNKYNLEDHRKDDKYKQWVDEYNEYNKKRNLVVENMKKNIKQ